MTSTAPCCLFGNAAALLPYRRGFRCRQQTFRRSRGKDAEHLRLASRHRRLPHTLSKMTFAETFPVRSKWKPPTLPRAACKTRGDAPANAAPSRHLSTTLMLDFDLSLATSQDPTVSFPCAAVGDGRLIRPCAGFHHARHDLFSLGQRAGNCDGTRPPERGKSEISARRIPRQCARLLMPR